MANRNINPVLSADIKALYSLDNGTNWIPFYSLSMEIQDKKNTEDITPAGHRTATGVSYGKEWSEITLRGQVTYGEFKTFVNTLENTPTAPQSFTLYYGTANNGFKYDGCVVTGWAISQDENAMNLAISLVGSKGKEYAPSSTHIKTIPAENMVILRGRNSFNADGSIDDTVGTSIRYDDGSKSVPTYVTVPDWYNWSVEVGNIAQNVYYGYAISPSFQGNGVISANYSLSWDANVDNISDSSKYTAGYWVIQNTTDNGGEYSIILKFASMCVENQGYADEQEIVRSYQSSHRIIEGSDNVVTVLCTGPTNE